MRRLLFLVLFALLLGVLLSQWIDNHPSYLLIVVDNTSIEMSLWLAIGLVLGVYSLAAICIAVTRKGLKGSWAQLTRLFIGSSARAQRETSRGLIDFLEGNWKSSLKLLTRSARHADTPLLNYLAAARSAYELGEEKQAVALLHKAEGVADNAELAVALTQARMQLLAKKFEQCAATLERARKSAPKHPVVLDLLQQVYVALSDWQALEPLMPLLKRYKVLPAAELNTLYGKLYHQLLSRAAQSKIGSTNTAESRVKHVWQQLNKDWQQQADLILHYADLLLVVDAAQDVEALVRKALKKNWDNRLVERYGLLECPEPGRQLLHAEGWMKERPGNAELLLTLGRLSLRNNLWGKARDYFQSSLALQGSPAVYAELARLLAHMGDLKRSTEYYQQGLMLAADGLPELPMPEDHSAMDQALKEANA